MCGACDTLDDGALWCELVDGWVCVLSAARCVRADDELGWPDLPQESAASVCPH